MQDEVEVLYDCLYPAVGDVEEKGFSTYTLRVKFQISGSTVQRLRRNMSVSTNTLDDLCRLLDCSLSEIAEHVPDKQQPKEAPGGK
jgi:putative transcriptional regulator